MFMKSPYSYFGGKRSVSNIIWSGLGNIENYIEPFFGSLSILLNNPQPSKVETVNDLDCFLVNFWRSLQFDIDNIIKYAKFPVSEVELHSRHQWLLSEEVSDILKKILNDPNFFDAKIAGYWIYGQCASIGNNWLNSKGLKALPLLSSAGGGIHGLKFDFERDFKILQDRIKRVRITCGDWSRILTPSILQDNKGLSKNGVTGIVLDPPYSLSSRSKVYKEDSDIYSQVCEWAINQEYNDKLRIVVCGYDGDFDFPDTWNEFHWQSNGGLASLGNANGRKNTKRETIYFSPSCLKF